MMALWFYVCGIFPVCRDLYAHPLGVTQIRLYLWFWLFRDIFCASFMVNRYPAHYKNTKYIENFTTKKVKTFWWKIQVIFVFLFKT